MAGNVLPLMLLFFAPLLGIVGSKFLMFFLTGIFLLHFYILSEYIENKRTSSAETKKTAKETTTQSTDEKASKSINVKRFGLAFGITGAFLYVGCILLMLTVGREGTVLFFNSLLHGLETSSIISMQLPWWEALMGIAETFIISWFLGACIAAFYNISSRRKE